LTKIATIVQLIYKRSSSGDIVARTQSLKVLHRKIRELQLKAEELERAEKSGIKQLRALLKKYGLGLADVKIALSESVRSERVKKLKGRKVKPKYRNPDKRSETWTGRGRMPLWMAALVKKGKKPEDFLIED
jgi:DNA-binding protein H-NS